MGYYTDYSLEHNSSMSDSDIANELSYLTGYRFDNDLEIYQVKWYNWAEDMRIFSQRHPTTLFTLNGIGEESEDIWRAYIQNGKMQVSKAILVFEPFDESKMK